MAAKPRVRVVVDKSAVEQLTNGDEAKSDVERRAEAIADACNGESEWGGYYSAAIDGNEAGANVWSSDNRNDDARDQRMIRNMSAGDR